MRRALALGAALAIAAALPAAASAHARLLFSTPANGEHIVVAPRAATFHFDDKVAVGPDNAVVDNSGASKLAGQPRTAGRVLELPLKPITSGDYTVRWSVVSDDGHTIDGVIVFGFGSVSAPSTPLLSAGASGPDALDLIARWLLIGGALVAAGAGFFLVAVRRTRDARITLLVGAGFAAAAFGGAIERNRVPDSTRFAHATEAAVIAGVVGAVLAGLALRWTGLQRLLVAPAVGLLVAISFGGHALDAGVSRIQAVVDVAHLAAAAAWIGGLAALALTLRSVDSIEAAKRFSRVALASVVIVAVTGTLRAFSELTSFRQLFSSGYGRALVVKTVLFAGLLAVAYVARVRLRDRPEPLRRSAGAELALFAGLVVAVAFLTSLPPGRSLAAAPAAPRSASGPPPLPPQGAVTLAKQWGDRGVAVAARNENGGLEVTTTVFGPQGDGVDGLDVRVNGRPSAPCGFGCYRTSVASTALLNVGLGTTTLAFRLPQAPKNGGGLLSRIDAAYLRTPSSAFHEQLASGRNQVVESDWLVAAPNRLAYTANDGTAGIIIGGRRWDRQKGGPWQPSPQSPVIPQPQLPWTRAPLDAVVLPPARVGGRPVVRVSFVDPATPAWYTVSADPRTLRLAQIEMVATAHFMRDTYRASGSPVRIVPPPAR